MLTSHLGEIISLFVAVLWTGSAVAFEFAGRRVGSLVVNILRLIVGGIMLGILLWVISGNPLPLGADTETWFWMLISGIIGFVIGDMCLFHSYLIITSRISQLIMTLAPPIAALFGFILLGERIRLMGLLAMAVTLSGIAVAIFGSGQAEKDGGKKIKLNLPLYGVLLAFGGAIGQGLGIVLSKKGMDAYALSDTLGNLAENPFYIPFAATQIRIIAGIIGFVGIIIFMKQVSRVRLALKDKQAMTGIVIGSFCGPFAGVSLSLMAIRYTETGIASTVMALVPIIIIIPSILLFKQKVSFREVIGAIISVVGVALFFIG